MSGVGDRDVERGDAEQADEVTKSGSLARMRVSRGIFIESRASHRRCSAVKNELMVSGASKLAAVALCFVHAVLGFRCSGERASVKDSGEPFWVFTVRQDGKEFDVLSLLSPDDVSPGGIPRLAQVGQVLRRAQEQDRISPEDFRPNPAFVDLLHDTIGLYGPYVSELQSQAEELGEGLVYVIDKRTTKPPGEVATEDTFGSFRASEGELVMGSYRRNERHELLTRDGFFELQDDLRQRLLERLKNARD